MLLRALRQAFRAPTSRLKTRTKATAARARAASIAQVIGEIPSIPLLSAFSHGP